MKSTDQVPRLGPSRVGEMASPFFCESLLDDLGLEALLGIHLLEPAILFLQLLEARHQGGVHAAELGALLVEGGAANPVLTAQIRYGNARFGLLENGQDLAIAEWGCLQCKTFSARMGENSTSDDSGFQGGLPTI